MRYCRIRCNFGGIGDLCKLSKDSLSANYAFHSRQNSETFDILHAFLAKLPTLKNSPFLAHPVDTKFQMTVRKGKSERNSYMRLWTVECT